METKWHVTGKGKDQFNREDWIKLAVPVDVVEVDGAMCTVKLLMAVETPKLGKLQKGSTVKVPAIHLRPYPAGAPAFVPHASIDPTKVPGNQGTGPKPDKGTDDKGGEAKE